MSEAGEPVAVVGVGVGVEAGGGAGTGVDAAVGGVVGAMSTLTWIAENESWDGAARVGEAERSGGGVAFIDDEALADREGDGGGEGGRTVQIAACNFGDGGGGGGMA